MYHRITATTTITMEHKKRVNSLRIILQQQDVGHRPVKITK